MISVFVNIFNYFLQPLWTYPFNIFSRFFYAIMSFVIDFCYSKKDM